jgi:hypothetical protein
MVVQFVESVQNKINLSVKARICSCQTLVRKIFAKEVIHLSFLLHFTSSNIWKITIYNPVNRIYKVHLIGMLQCPFGIPQITYNILAIKYVFPLWKDFFSAKVVKKFLADRRTL